MVTQLRNSPEIRRAHDLTKRKTIATPEPVLYVHEQTAGLMGLSPEDIVHPDYHTGYVFLHNKEEVSDLRAIQAAMEGKHHDIDRPIVAMGADGATPTLMVADTETDAYEIQDILGEQLEKQEKELRRAHSDSNRAPVMDTDWVRYVNGAPVGEKRVEMVHDAFVRKIDEHKHNPVTNPGRDPWKEAREKGLLVDPIVTAVPENYKVKKGKKK